ncbi:MAG: Shikimate kinase [Candidatus Anoxychlamydiales bacterium]|nr:Shikimate kinase [Candidatus Anoxychlamydiales bacterium]
MNIVLIGFKNAGKSSVAKKLSKILQKKLIDTDELIKRKIFEKFKKRLNIFEIFTFLKEEKFRKLESIVVLSIKDVEDSVIALGGGAILNQENILAFKDKKILYLKASKKILKNRIAKEKKSIFTDDKLFEEKFERRKSIYERFADVTIQTDNKDIETIAYEIREKVYV